MNISNKALVLQLLNAASDHRTCHSNRFLCSDVTFKSYKINVLWEIFTVRMINILRFNDVFENLEQQTFVALWTHWTNFTSLCSQYTIHIVFDA